MSFGIYWRPEPVPPKGHQLPTGFKYAIAPAWWQHDGSLRGTVLLDKEWTDYLRGIRDISEGEVMRAAQELLNAIRDYGIIKVWIGNEDE